MSQFGKGGRSTVAGVSTLTPVKRRRLVLDKGFKPDEHEAAEGAPG